tara:strand:- start:256 stop:681 length:426 start_codon:yes stop_codon:yes gene_type:complete
MKNNYLYDLPEDLQDRIYYINTKKSKNILNKELDTVYNSIKYINQSINDVETKLYNYMDNNNISSYINELAIMNNIPLLKDEIIEELNSSLLIKKKLSHLLFKYNSDNEFCEELVPEPVWREVELILVLWDENMEDLLLQN